MTYFAKSAKIDLITLADELGIKLPENPKVIEIKKLITESKDYDEEFTKELLETITNSRSKIEEVREEKEREEKERMFELEKLKLRYAKENAVESGSDCEMSNPCVLKNIMQRYEIKDGDISFYLVLFERQVKRLKLKPEDWVNNLVSLLPYEINQLIAREPEEKCSDYQYIKALLLKRFKLSPDKFRQKFFEHVKLPKSTWKDFTYELKNYFNEWLQGMQINDFEGLKELIITDQLKKKAPRASREHFVDDWAKFLKSTELAEKLDEFENVRGGNLGSFHTEIQSSRSDGESKLNIPSNKMKSNNFNYYSRNEINGAHGNNSYNNRRYEPNKNTGSRNSFRNEKQLSCFICGDKHYARDCPNRRNKFADRKFEAKDNGEKIHLAQTEPNQKFSVNTNDSESISTYIKLARINDNHIEVNCLIDTGSSCCLLKKSIAEKLNLVVEPAANQLFGFGNSTLSAAKALGKTYADISIDNVKGKNIEILIVEDIATPYELLVGRTYLDIDDIVFARIGKHLHIHYAIDNPFAEIQCEADPQRIELKTKCPVLLESNSVNYVKAKSEKLDDGLLMIDGTEDELGTLLEVRRGETVVPITNFRSEKIILKKNQCVARAETAEIIELDENDSMKHVTGKEILTVNNVIEFKKPITLEEVKIDSGVDNQRKLEILKLVNEFRDCFALSLSELGCTNLIKMDIKEVENSKPICMRPYRTNAEERATIREIVSDWKKNGIVTETRSPYASPVLLVKKKTGEARLVVDYRKLNSQTIKDKFPLPRIDDLLERLSECKFFSVLDLAHGYLQIPLTEEAKLKTAFITDEETGQFERMIFGLANAPSEFQRLMNRVLGPLLNKEVLCYLDDILVPAKSWDQMMEKLRKIFECLREAKLTLKITKCEFAKSEVEYLGFLIKQEGLQPGMRKVRAITSFPEPTNEHGVRQFLGLTSFFRRFVPKYAELAEPLTKLTRKDERFQWREDQQQAFDMLKKHLSNQPVLALYNPEAETEVHTDASSKGLAGMLLQKGKDKKWHLVYCVSKGTTEAEKNYHSSKLELMAIVWTLTRLRQFLIGIKFTIITDCEALVYMNAKKTTNPQIARWSNLIQEYDFNVKHRPGEKMNHVDALSRSPAEPPEETLDSIIEDNLEVCLTLTIDEQVLLIQHADPELKKLITIFKKEKHERTKIEEQQISNYVFKRNRLYRAVKGDEGEKLLYVIPKNMRKSTVVKFHDLMGHFSVDKTVSKIKELYWFPSMKRYVRKHVSMCFECLINKVPGGKQQGLLHPIKPGKRPFSILHIDHLGPFVKSSRSNQDLLVMIDNFTRFTRLTPVRSTKVQYVLKALKNFVNEFGLPDRIISDRGSSFTSQQFEDYCRNNGITHTLNSTKHPQANGMVERINRTIIPAITTSMEDYQHRDWDLKIKEVERNLNSMINKTTNKTPFEMLHGYSPRFHDGILRREADDTANIWTDPRDIQTSAKSRIEERQLKMKDDYDKKRCGSIRYEPGEIVVMKRAPVQTGQPTKTQPKYRGPMTVATVLPNDTYKVTQLEKSKKGRFYTTTAHVSQLKPWKCSEESDDEDDNVSDEAEEETDLQPRRNPTRAVARPCHYGK